MWYLIVIIDGLCTYLRDAIKIALAKFWDFFLNWLFPYPPSPYWDKKFSTIWLTFHFPLFLNKKMITKWKICALKWGSYIKSLLGKVRKLTSLSTLFWSPICKIRVNLATNIDKTQWQWDSIWYPPNQNRVKKFLQLTWQKFLKIKLLNPTLLPYKSQIEGIILDFWNDPLPPFRIKSTYFAFFLRRP